MSVPWPDEAPELWNTLSLGGVALPGLAKVDVRVSQEIEVKKPKGKHGATETRQGYNPADVKIRLRFWEPEQFTQFQTVLAKLWPEVAASKKDGQPGKVDGPVKIDHPKTRLWNITAIQIKSIDDKNGDSPGGFYDIDLDCIKYYPPPKVNATKTDKKTLDAFAGKNALDKGGPTPPTKPSVTGNHP